MRAWRGLVVSALALLGRAVPVVGPVWAPAWVRPPPDAAAAESSAANAGVVSRLDASRRPVDLALYGDGIVEALAGTYDMEWRYGGAFVPRREHRFAVVQEVSGFGVHGSDTTNMRCRPNAAPA